MEFEPQSLDSNLHFAFIKKWRQADLHFLFNKGDWNPDYGQASFRTATLNSNPHFSFIRKAEIAVQQMDKKKQKYSPKRSIPISTFASSRSEDQNSFYGNEKEVET